MNKEMLRTWSLIITGLLLVFLGLRLISGSL